MTHKIYHTVKIELPGAEPDLVFVHHPDGRLVQDERSPDEIAEAARDREGKDGIVEAAIRYVSPYASGMWKTYEQIKRRQRLPPVRLRSGSVPSDRAVHEVDNKLFRKKLCACRFCHVRMILEVKRMFDCNSTAAEMNAAQDLDQPATFTMTAKQKKTLADLRVAIERNINGIGHEIKQWEVETCKWFVSLVVVTGRPNDEGTLAEVYCRDLRHIFIGKIGGCEIITGHKKDGGSRKRRGFMSAVIYTTK